VVLYEEIEGGRKISTRKEGIGVLYRNKGGSNDGQGGDLQRNRAWWQDGNKKGKKIRE
jgi:hypothetical protein